MDSDPCACVFLGKHLDLTCNYLDGLLSDHWSVCHLFDPFDPVQCIEWTVKAQQRIQVPIRAREIFRPASTLSPKRDSISSPFGCRICKMCSFLVSLSYLHGKEGLRRMRRTIGWNWINDKKEIRLQGTSVCDARLS